MGQIHNKYQAGRFTHGHRNNHSKCIFLDITIRIQKVKNKRSNHVPTSKKCT
jgi:hypothetical protein